MSAITERAALRIRQIMGRFDSERAVITRPGRDAYRQPTAEETEVGTAQVWRNAMSRPDKWQISEAGQTYDMDGMIWVCLLAPAPAAERGDTVTISGERYTLRNSVRDSADVRVYWQLQKNQ